jgi:hypothetical protein
MDYIRNYYHVPAKRGMMVRRKDKPEMTGKILSAHGSHLCVRMNGCKYYFHPLDLEYLQEAAGEK